ncbi:MAG: GNAT family N-acetyltransferase [Desulfobacterales bacterium]|nr:GNAT family N-acetyltransferase [Desulfobacterales bacterium]
MFYHNHRFQTRIINTGEAFSALKKEWNDLLHQSSWDTLFLTWEWQFSWWESFGGELFIVLVFENKTLVGILPFIKIRRLFLHVLKFIGTVDSDYLDFIIKKGFEKEIVSFFFNVFLKNHPGIEIIELESINERSPLFQYISHVFPNDYFGIETKEKVCAFLDLPGSWEQYLSSLSSNMRYYIRRKEKKIKKEFDVCIGIENNKEHLQTRMTHFFEQHQKRWNRLERPGAFFSEPFKEFHKNVSKRFFEAGFLRLYYLELNNRPVASYYLFKYQKTVHFYLTGFDPEYRQFSPSVVLLAHAVKDAIDQGLDEFDFMREAYDYKLKWNPRTRINRSFTIIKHKSSAKFYVLLVCILRKCAERIKRLLPSRSKLIIRKLLPRRIVNSFDPFFRE